MNVQEISKVRFDAMCYVRDPSLIFMFGMQELAWFEAFDKKILAVITKDLEEDHSYIIFGRDGRRLFQLIDIPTVVFKNPEQARAALYEALKKYENDGKHIYPRGNEAELPNEIFTPQVKEDALHDYFKILAQNKGYEAARKLITEAAYAFIDVDGNYIKDFQTTGFDSRLWELYLYLYFVNSGFEINRRFQAPDFLIDFLGNEVAVEAVSVNASEKFDEKVAPETPEEIHRLTTDYMPIKFGSPLTAKLNKLHKGKRYWELDHIKGRPLILAVHDYHLRAKPGSFGSMTWSRQGLEQYLYGVRMKSKIVDGRVKVELVQTQHGIQPIYETIEKHEWKDKSIPSNFFRLPEG